MKYSTIYHIASKNVHTLIVFKMVFMYKNKVIIIKIKFITPINDYVIPVD